MARFTESGGLAAKIIAGRRDKARTREGWIRLGINVLVLVLVVLFLFAFVLFVHRVNGNDMYPAAQDGDVIIGWRLDRNFQKDDLVVYDVDGRTYTGRVVAREGDIVDISDSGIVSIDGTPDTDALYSTDKGDMVSYPYAVPEGYVFILGDFRTQATDSRELGAIPASQVEGAAIGLIRRRNF